MEYMLSRLSSSQPQTRHSEAAALPQNMKPAIAIADNAHAELSELACELGKLAPDDHCNLSLPAELVARATQILRRSQVCSEESSRVREDLRAREAEVEELRAELVKVKEDRARVYLCNARARYGLKRFQMEIAAENLFVDVVDSKVPTRDDVLHRNSVQRERIQHIMQGEQAIERLRLALNFRGGDVKRDLDTLDLTLREAAKWGAPEMSKSRPSGVEALSLLGHSYLPCPACLDSKLAHVRMCGHAVCRTCRDMDSCPVCQQEDSKPDEAAKLAQSQQAPQQTQAKEQEKPQENKSNERKDSPADVGSMVAKLLLARKNKSVDRV